MIPFPNALAAFLSIFSLLPVPFKAFIGTFMFITFALAIFRFFTTRT